MVFGHSTFVVCWFKKKKRERDRKQKSFAYRAEALNAAF